MYQFNQRFTADATKLYTNFVKYLKVVSKICL